MSEILDYLIVGAGPAGVQMTLFMKQAGRKFITLESSKVVGSFYLNQPRHGKLISINKLYNTCQDKDYNLRHDWNSLLSDSSELLFRNYSQEIFPSNTALVQYMSDFADKLDLLQHIKFETTVSKVERNADNIYTVTDSNGVVYKTKVLLMATGAMKENCPDIPGLEDMPSYSSHSIDQMDYARKKVLIIGKGNSAFEVADHLSSHAANLVMVNRTPIRHAWNTHFVGHLRAVNNNFLDLVRLKSNHSIENWQPVRARKIAENDSEASPSASGNCGRDGSIGKFKYCVTVRAREGQEFDFIADEVIRCCGWKYILPEMFGEGINSFETVKEERLAKLTDSWESTTNTELYFMGTSMQACDPQSASGFIHGFRYNVRTLFNVLENKYFQKELPHTVLENSPAAIAKHLSMRASHSSGLWQMFSFMQDVVTINEGVVKYHNELRCSWVHDSPDAAHLVKKSQFAFTLQFAFGDKHYMEGEDPSSWDIVTPQKHTACGINIHPVIKAYENGELKQILHLRVTLDGHWDQADSLTALGHLVNTRIKVDKEEPNAAAPYDYFKLKRDQDSPSASTATWEQNEKFYHSNGWIHDPSFARECTLPEGTAAFFHNAIRN